MMMEDPSLPIKKAILEKRDSPFASSNGRLRSYQEEAAVAPELRSRLESIGMRTRFNVNRGYGSPPPSQAQDRFDGTSNSIFATDHQILQSVENTRSQWNRTKSAPMYYNNELTPFCGRLQSPLIMNSSNDKVDGGDHNENDDPEGGLGESVMSSGIGFSTTDLKRNRDDIFGEFMAEGEEDHAEDAAMSLDDSAQKPIASLPKRSSPVSSSNTTASSAFSNRNNAQTLPISSGLASYLSSAQEAAWTTHDFSSFVNRSDF